MPDYIKNIVTNPLFGLATGLAGFLIGHCLHLGRDRLARFNDAAQKFRDAFKEELYYFSPGTKGMIYVENILSSAESRHIMAYNDFILHLPRFKQRRFTKAWIQYNNCINTYKDQATTEARKKVISNIYNCMCNLLSYAKPK